MATTPTQFAKAALAGVLALTVVAGGASAQQVNRSEKYVPTIWIDPDGCEHWAMDDGSEGFMSPHRRRDGSAVCHRSEICGVVPTDQLFATDKYAISAALPTALTLSPVLRSPLVAALWTSGALANASHAPTTTPLPGCKKTAASKSTASAERKP